MNVVDQNVRPSCVTISIFTQYPEEPFKKSTFLSCVCFVSCNNDRLKLLPSNAWKASALRHAHLCLVWCHKISSACGTMNDQLQRLQQICTFETLGDEISILFMQRYEALLLLFGRFIWSMSHVRLLCHCGKMKEVLTGSYCGLFVVLTVLSVSAKSRCDVFPFDSNIKSDCCRCSLVH